MSRERVSLRVEDASLYKYAKALERRRLTIDDTLQADVVYEISAEVGLTPGSVRSMKTQLRKVGGDVGAARRYVETRPGRLSSKTDRTQPPRDTKVFKVAKALADRGISPADRMSAELAEEIAAEIGSTVASVQGRKAALKKYGSVEAVLEEERIRSNGSKKANRARARVRGQSLN